MAISKTQNERPAINALIDAINDGEIAMRQVAQNLAILTNGLADEVSNRESNDVELQSAIDLEVSNRESNDAALQSAIALEVSNRTAAVSNVQGQIGVGVFSENFTISEAFTGASQTIGNWTSTFPNVSITQLFTQAFFNISEFMDAFKFGVTDTASVPAGSSMSGGLTFATSFAENSDIAVFLVCVDSEERFTDLSCKLVSATSSDFSYTVTNDSQSDVTIKVGYLAVRVG